ncbi:MAG: valine--tRNA ligase, partial [Candidatus Harrisonbacteria bacterium CG10_big_fil_rev_8_21_14_0_10_49_15]
NVNKPFTVANSKINGIDSGSETTLKELMTKVVESGQITITPDRFNAVYFNWINNLRDWCISRQIWYGHRIPVWYKGEEIYVGTEAPTGDGWDQDPDTLDTWFSSGLWTFSTLGWPNETEDLKTYHPTSVLETGYDILFFWVAKMILMTGFLLGDIPFKQVYLHGLVRDEKGKKMSKSLGNIIDPLDMADKYGADATRLSLIIGAAAGNDMKLSEDKVRGYKNFANKI